MTNRGERRFGSANTNDDALKLIGTTEPIDYFEMAGMSIVDCTGVPLSSDRAPEVLTVEIDFRHMPCPYKDSPSRQRSKVPMSGLEQSRLREQFTEILDIATYFSTVLYPEDTERLNWGQTVQLLAILKYLPHYLKFRASQPVAQDNMPQSVIVGSNCAAGTYGAVTMGMEPSRLPDELRNEIESSAVAPIDLIIGTSEFTDSLIGPKTVCAASEGMMKRYMRGIIEREHPPVVTCPLDPEIFSPDELGNLVRTSNALNTIQWKAQLRAEKHFEFQDQLHKLETEAATALSEAQTALVHSILTQQVANRKAVLMNLAQLEFEKDSANIVETNNELNRGLGRVSKKRPQPFVLPPSAI